MHSGIGGLAHVLAEVREARAVDRRGAALADGIAARIRGNVATTTAYSYFDGLVSDLGVLSALGADGASGGRPARGARRRTTAGSSRAGLAAVPAARAASTT